MGNALGSQPQRLRDRRLQQDRSERRIDPFRPAELKYLGPVLMPKPNQPLFRITYPELLNNWKAALRKIGLPETYAAPHQLRHSGASWDRLKQNRTIMDIKLRGRGMSDSSLKRYESHAKVAQLYDKLPPAIKRRAEASPGLLQAMVTSSSSRKNPMDPNGLKPALELFAGCACVL